MAHRRPVGARRQPQPGHLRNHRRRDDDSVRAALFAAAGTLWLEILAAGRARRARLGAVDVVVQLVVGVALGLGVLALRVILH